MIRSKYLGKTFDNEWKVTNVSLAGRYGKRGKPKGNSYNYILTRETTDGKCIKSLMVSRPTMARIARGLLKVEQLEYSKNKRNSQFNNSAYYMFLKN